MIGHSSFFHFPSLLPGLQIFRNVGFISPVHCVSKSINYAIYSFLILKKDAELFNAKCFVSFCFNIARK